MARCRAAEWAGRTLQVGFAMLPFALAMLASHVDAGSHIQSSQILVLWRLSLERRCADQLGAPISWLIVMIEWWSSAAAEDCSRDANMTGPLASNRAGMASGISTLRFGHSSGLRESAFRDGYAELADSGVMCEGYDLRPGTEVCRCGRGRNLPQAMTGLTGAAPRWLWACRLAIPEDRSGSPRRRSVAGLSACW